MLHVSSSKVSIVRHISWAFTPFQAFKHSCINLIGPYGPSRHERNNTLLLEANSVSIHKRNLQMLMIEVYKTVQNVNPSSLKEIFVQKDITHNLRNSLPMCIPKTRTTSYGIESLFFLECKLWNNLPDVFKAIKTLA